MAVIQEEVGQELYTRDHGTVKVDKLSWMDGGYHIVLCPNGAYMHSNGLPVKDEKELRKAFGPNKEDLEKALKWFGTRHEQAENPPRPIGFREDNCPVFADGTVPDFDDLYAFFKPGPILTAAIVALQEHKQRTPGVPPKELRRSKEPAPAPTAEVAPPKPKAPKQPRTSKTKAQTAGATG